MRLAELRPIWREALACYESLRRLGFESESIMLTRHDDGRLMLAVPRVRYGLVVNLRPGEGDARGLAAATWDEIALEWERAAAAWNEAPPEEAEALFQSSLIRDQATLLVADLFRMDIAIPAACDA